MAQWDRCQSGATGMDRCCCKQKIKGRKLYFRFPANTYLFKVNNRNTRKRYEICSELTIEIPERDH